NGRIFSRQTAARTAGLKIFQVCREWTQGISRQVKGAWANSASRQRSSTKRLGYRVPQPYTMNCCAEVYCHERRGFRVGKPAPQSGRVGRFCGRSIQTGKI